MTDDLPPMTDSPPTLEPVYPVLRVRTGYHLIDHTARLDDDPDTGFRS